MITHHHLNGTDVAELAQVFSTTKKWYQIYTKPNTEKKLYEKIISLGFEGYLPIRKISKQWSDRVKVIEVPAFKSYIFSKLHSEEMQIIEKLSEFCSFIKYGNIRLVSQEKFEFVFPYITDQTIETMKTVLEAFPCAELQEQTLLKGDRVVIATGQLKGYQGVLVESPTGKKVAVKLEGLKQSLLITIPLELLKQVA